MQGKPNGLTESVVAVLQRGAWVTCAQVVAQVPPEHRANTNVILCQLFKRELAERRGVHRAYEYRWKPGATFTVRRAKKSPNEQPRPVPRFESAKPFAASLGTVVGEVVSDNAPPANPSQGRIEDALAAALDKREARMLDQVLASVPNGWSRIDVIGAIADGVVAGWIRPRRAGARDAYLLLRDPPPVRHNPQVERFKAHRLLDQCRLLDADAADALVAAREYDAPPELVRALVDLRRAAARTVQQLEA